MSSVAAVPLADVRTRLIQQKYYRAPLPQVLEDWLWSLGPSASAERVFRVHWGEGYKQVCRGGTYVTQISEVDMARVIGASVATVQRAYRELKTLKVLRRIEPPRGEDPLKRPVTQTEVLVPQEVLSAFLASPDRRKPIAPAPDQLPAQERQQAPAKVEHIPGFNPEAFQGAWEACKKTLQAQLQEQEFSAFVAPLLAQAAPGRLTLMAPNRFVLDWIRGHHLPSIKAAMAAGIEGRPPDVVLVIGSEAEAPKVSGEGIGKSQPVVPVKLMTARRIRERLSEVVPSGGVDRVLHEVLWSLIHGSFRKEPAQLKAINACVKLVREGHWRRPKRMPSGWQFELTIFGPDTALDKAVQQ